MDKRVERSLIGLCLVSAAAAIWLQLADIERAKEDSGKLVANAVRAARAGVVHCAPPGPGETLRVQRAHQASTAILLCLYHSTGPDGRSRERYDVGVL